VHRDRRTIEEFPSFSDVVVFPCSDGASFMTGSQIAVDGGALSHS
jgi:NAD(P)-dependent dehydrogenase (short-subunit alcohol dehydrogenase family)